MAILPLAFVGAIFLGDGLLTAQGYQSGDSDIPVGVALQAGVPAVLVLITPAVCAVVFGLRRAGSAGEREPFQHWSGWSLPQYRSCSTPFRWLWACRHVLLHLRDSRGRACPDCPGDQLRVSTSLRPVVACQGHQAAGFGVMAVFSVLAGLFIAGEAFEEPGGTEAISLVLAWLIPLVGLAGLAWSRPRLATPIMIVLSERLSWPACGTPSTRRSGAPSKTSTVPCALSQYSR